MRTLTVTRNDGVAKRKGRAHSPQAGTEETDRDGSGRVRFTRCGSETVATCSLYGFEASDGQAGPVPFEFRATYNPGERLKDASCST